MPLHHHQRPSSAGARSSFGASALSVRPLRPRPGSAGAARSVAQPGLSSLDIRGIGVARRESRAFGSYAKTQDQHRHEQEATSHVSLTHLRPKRVYNSMSIRDAPVLPGGVEADRTHFLSATTSSSATTDATSTIRLRPASAPARRMRSGASRINTGLIRSASPAGPAIGSAGGISGGSGAGVPPVVPLLNTASLSVSGLGVDSSMGLSTDPLPKARTNAATSSLKLRPSSARAAARARSSMQTRPASARAASNSNSSIGGSSGGAGKAARPQSTSARGATEAAQSQQQKRRLFTSSTERRVRRPASAPPGGRRHSSSSSRGVDSGSVGKAIGDGTSGGIVRTPAAAAAADGASAAPPSSAVASSAPMQQAQSSSAKDGSRNGPSMPASISDINGESRDLADDESDEPMPIAAALAAPGSRDAESITSVVAVKIKDGLFLGNAVAARIPVLVAANKVTHVVNCAGTQVPNHFEAFGVHYLSLSWPDSSTTLLFDSQNRTLSVLARFIDEAADNGEGVLVHSMRGDNRSCAALIAYFMYRYHWSFDTASALVQQRHSRIMLRPAYTRQLRALEVRLSALDTHYSAEQRNDIEREELLLRNTMRNSLAGSSERPASASMSLTSTSSLQARRRTRAASRRRVAGKGRGIRWIDEERGLATPAVYEEIPRVDEDEDDEGEEEDDGDGDGDGSSVEDRGLDDDQAMSDYTHPGVADIADVHDDDELDYQRYKRYAMESLHADETLDDQL